MEEQNITRQAIEFKAEEIKELEELLSNPEKYNITTIIIAKNVIFQTEQGPIKIIKTDYNHPLRVTKGLINKGNQLEINEEYFLANSSQIYTLIQKLMKENKNNKVSIGSKVLITDDILNTIIENENITEVDLTRYEINPEEQYELTNELYQKLKQSKTPKVVTTSKVSPELEDNFDPIIGFNSQRFLIGYSKYEKLQNEKEILTITSEITEEELNNLKYINPNKNIHINIDNYEFIEKIIDRLIELNINPKITIWVEDKEKFNTTQIFQQKRVNF